MDSNDVVDVLNTLIETSKDGEYGFGTCADHARSPGLRAMLRRCAEDCRQATQELKTVIERHGGVPETGLAGNVPRGWVAARGTLADFPDEAILDECERGEDMALRRYADAIATPLPADVHSVVHRQLEEVTRIHDQIRRLRVELPV